MKEVQFTLLLQKLSIHGSVQHQRLPAYIQFRNEKGIPKANNGLKEVALVSVL